MKNYQAVLNIILTAAVVVLFVRSYSTEKPAAAPVVIKGEAASAKAVFVNSDSLMDAYNLFKVMKAKIEKQRDSVDQALSRTGNSLQSDIEAYQQAAEGMSPSERQLREESLMRRQQAFVKSREDAMDKLSKQEEALNDSLHNDLVNFLKEFNKAHGYDFIFGYQRGSGILLANDSLDITKQVLSGLNKPE